MDNDMREFITRLAVDAFNSQFKFKNKFSHRDFDVATIPANNNSKFGFEVVTLRTDDSLRLRLYCNLSNVNKIGRFSYHDEAGHGTGIGDEIFVADCTLNNEFLEYHNNIIRRNITVLQSDESLLNVLLCEDGINAIVPGDDPTDYLDLGF